MHPFSVLTAVFLLFGNSSGRAANYVVTSTADPGAGSLRQAILDANATAVADEISFSAAAFPHIEISNALGIAPDYWRDSGPDSGNLTSRRGTLPGERFFLRVKPEKPLQ